MIFYHGMPVIDQKTGFVCKQHLKKAVKITLILISVGIQIDRSAVSQAWKLDIANLKVPSKTTKVTSAHWARVQIKDAVSLWRQQRSIRQTETHCLYLAALQQVEHEWYACGDELRAVVRRADGGELWEEGDDDFVPAQLLRSV